MIFFRKEEPEPEAPLSDAEVMRRRAEGAALPDNVREAVLRELARMEKTDPAVAEYSIAYSYVDTLLALPWTSSTEDNLDLVRAEAVLDGSHFGLRQVKDRILEYLATRSMKNRAERFILVVDDEEIARTNLHHVLRREGYHVETAANGAEALEKVKRWEFDLIVTDLKMERMDGLQLLAEAKLVSPSTQIMMVTGFATVDTAVKAMQSGAVHYLAKPVDLDELRSTVRRILDARGRIEPSRSPILCFTGPPGVGKTSVGRAIAEALGRKFYRMSLADLRDEAELRGHRRTYAGALPGRVMQALRSLGAKNPVFMLDEMDKVGQDVRGDPATALLEILDPEQNGRYVDRYVDLPFDLSSVLFIATANGVERLAGPILDRMEVVAFSGYSEAEKKGIAERFLIPRQLRDHGLTHPLPRFSDEAVAGIIREYTNEAGVRGLDREIARICRKLARSWLTEGPQSCPEEIGVDHVRTLLGPARFRHDAVLGPGRVGTATGLVWTEAGGEIVFVEASAMKGSGQLLLTGSLGAVLQESARIALSYMRANASGLGVDPDFFGTSDIHVHIPAGAISKDGPSAGLTIAVALASLLTGRMARPGVALSGEISLGGRVLPVSGVREKLLAAMRAGVSQVVLPADNAADVAAHAEAFPGGLAVLFVQGVAQALEAALV